MDKIRMPENTPASEPEKDPIIEGHVSWPLAIASLLLVLSTVWAIYDEFIGRRPWKAYQAAFVPAYRQYLGRMLEQQRTKENEILSDDQYQQLLAERDAVHREVEPQRKRLNEQIALANRRIEAITAELKLARSYTAATVYKIETASSENERQRLRDHLTEYHQGPFQVDLPDAGGGATTQTYDYEQLLDAFNRIEDDRSELRRKLGQLVQREAEKRKAVVDYMTQQLDGPSPARIEGLIASLESFRHDITSHQIHLEEVGLVDRCQVCHLAIGSPVEVTAGGIQASSHKVSPSMARAFTSHPKVKLGRGDLLTVHRVEQFGCTPCHGGNGRSLTSVEEAHGRYKHWLWPMHEAENVEAGCVQCHQGAVHLDGAPTLNRGRYLFQRLGCWGCHPRDGYDTEAPALKNVAQQERAIQDRRRELLKELDDIYESDDLDLDPDAVKQRLSQLDTDWDQAQFVKKSLQRAGKNPGPSLKDVRAKLKKEWIPAWLSDPRAYRPTTSMPRFELTEDQVRAISAFLWQASVEKDVPNYEPGDSQRGKDLFDRRGCRACHGLGDEESFSANLSRLDEKANDDYLVEWILNPYEGAIMPDLRLTEQEARDMVAYLTGERSGASYAPADFVRDDALYDQGKDLVRHFGCFGCHEIAGMESLNRIGTDLTKEGSKPIERLDFGRFTHEAKVAGWYRHKGFFDRKLADPRSFDEGRLKLDWQDKLRMPNFGLHDRPDDRRALVTFLLGSVDSQLPEFFYHNPTGPAKDVEEGWPLIIKYNCTGCHQIVPGQTPPILKLPRYEGEGRAGAPPSLVGAGARIEADWLIKFLQDPALSATKPHRNAARAYLDIRMPTYQVSEEEIGKLVRFLNALSKQPSPYPFEKLSPLNDDELADARAIFRAAKCLSCHVTSDDPRTFTTETKAPSYQVGAERLKPRWMRHWLRDPDQIMPGTVMPPFFKEVDGRWITTVLPEEKLRIQGADHVELMVRYQKFFDQAEAEYLLKLDETDEKAEDQEKKRTPP